MPVRGLRDTDRCASPRRVGAGTLGCVDPQALDLANKTLAAAIDSLMAKGAPLQPIVVVQRGDDRQVQRMMASRTEDATAMARQVASAQTDADVAAFAVDGSIPFGDASYDAVVVESWNFRTNRGARIGLRYELKGALRKKPSLIGSPLHRGKSGWFDPEEGEVPTFPEVASVADPGFGPPPVASSLAPADIAPPPPTSVFDVPALPRSFTEDTPAVAPAPAPTAPPAPAPPPALDFGPPPTTPAVAYDPPASHAPQAPPGPSAIDFPPPTLDFPPPVVVPEPVIEPKPKPEPAPAPPVDRPVPVYSPQPIQRSDTPLGNRAMFAGIMELATKGRSFPAFAIVQKDGEWEQVTMTDASLADAAASVRAYARSRTDAEFIAFAVDSFVTVGETEVEAVIVEVWEYATRVSFSVAQRYVPTGMPPSPRLTGRPLMRTKEGWVDVPASMMLGGQLQFAYSEPGGA